MTPWRNQPFTHSLRAICLAVVCAASPVVCAIVIPSAALFSGSVACGQIRFTDVTPQSGIAFRHTNGGSGQYYIVEYICAGLALFDYDRDGDMDIYFLSGAPLKGTTVDVAPRNALYRNDGDWKFTDVTDQAGVGDPGHGLGVVAGDYDNDGDLDLYVNNFGPNVLYRNNGDGTFSDVTEEAGVADGDKVGAGTCFLDIEGDGDLDLYVGNYVKFSYDKHVVRTVMGYRTSPSPRDYQPWPDTLYRNNGDGTFSDISVESGIAAVAGPSMGMVCADYDSDGDTDILVGNDVEANFLFTNDGKGKFEESALLSGVAYDFGGMEHGSMGVEAADYDNDGRIDFQVTSYQQELATLYKNLGDSLFEDVTLTTGAGQGTRRHVTWGNGLIDLDNDGHRDLFIARGHLCDTVDLYDDTTEFAPRNLVLRNNGEDRFIDVTDQCGGGLTPKYSSRGAVFGDLDNDGDLDVVVVNTNSKPSILRNDSATGNHWLQIRLQGKTANRDGVGTQVKLVADNLELIEEVHAGRGYQSHYGMRLHFGLGKHEAIDRIEVRWIGGGTDVLENVATDQILTIEEGVTR